MSERKQNPIGMLDRNSFDATRLRKLQFLKILSILTNIDVGCQGRLGLPEPIRSFRELPLLIPKVDLSGAL